MRTEGWTDGRTYEANNRFSQFFERAYLRASLRNADTESQKLACRRKVAERWKARRCFGNVGRSNVFHV